MSFGWDGTAQRSAMGALIAGHDWSRTALGLPAQWPDLLHSTVGLCLGADFPLALWWGEGLVQIYNDPFRRAIGPSRHASGFASPLASGWPDIWPFLSPALERIEGGETSVRLHDLPFVPAASGGKDGGEGAAGFFALSLSPVQMPESPMAGVLAAFHEAVPWAEVDRAQGLLLALREALQRFDAPDDLVAAGCEMVCLHMGLDRAGLALFDADGIHGTLWPDWKRGAARSAPKRFRLAEFGTGAAASWQAGRPFFEPGGAASAAGNPWDGLHASTQVPVREGDRLAAVLFAHGRRPRTWSQHDVDLLRRAGGEIGAAVARIRQSAALDACRNEVEALLRGLPTLAWRSAAHGRWTWSSPQWIEFTGLSRAESLGEGWLAAFHPDDREGLKAAWNAAERSGRLLADGRLRRAGDGAYQWFRLHAVPIPDSRAGGRHKEWLGTCIDVNDVYVLRERQAAQLRESQQRAQKTLGLIRALVRRSAETSPTVGSYAMHLDGQLDAFGRIQAIVSADPEGAVDLDYLVAEELAAHGAHEDGVIRIEGPTVRLRLSEAQAIGLAVHELVTHAVEDGALLGNAGAIRIGWRTEATDAGQALLFEWNEESGQRGRRAAAPDFHLLEKMLVQEMHARTATRFGDGRFSCRITMPLAGAPIEVAPR